MEGRNIAVSNEPFPSEVTQNHYISSARLVNPSVEGEKFARRRLLQAYMSGQPLFTKKAIRYAWEQVKRKPGHGGKAYSKDITGNTVEFKVDFTISNPPPECDCGDCDEDITRTIKWNKLSLLYATKGTLLKNFLKRSDGLLCPVTIIHDGYPVNAETTEALPLPPSYHFDGISALFSAGIQNWKKARACKKLKTILSDTARSHEINKTIGFALGGFSQQETCLAHAARNVTQHALLLTLKEWLQKRDGGEKKPCYVQDPSYNSVDKQVLEKAGLQVIDDPCGWLEVDEQSIVISVAPNVPVKEIIADIARPAVIIWERVGVEHLVPFTDGRDRNDPCSLRVVDMMEDYDAHVFGAGQDLSECGSLVLYVRKSKTAVPPNLR